ncbi:cell division protein FtsQ/DivIB [Patescibacteria group bacterium]|nr:cell division protein FtsQ/DivIB [Patescibacteria group bacterium]
MINPFKKRQRSKFINPYYQGAEENYSKLHLINKSYKIKLLVFEFIIVASTLVWFFYFSAVFDVNYVEIRGQRRIPKSELLRVVHAQINEDNAILGSNLNIFLLNEEKLKETLNEKYYLTSLEIIKDFPDRVDVLLVEEDYSAIWREGDNYYYINNEGLVVERANPLEIKSSYPLIDNSGENKFKANVIVGEEDHIAYILEIFKYFRKEQLDIKVAIDRFMVDGTDTLKLVLREGPYILFDFAQDAEQQVLKLVTIKDKKLTSDFFKKEYIDLRYGDRVYYR